MTINNTGRTNTPGLFPEKIFFGGKKMDGKKQLTVNCGLACLLEDKQGVIDNYDKVMINAGTVIISSKINAKITAKGGSINCGDLRIQDIKGEIIQLDKGAVIDGGTKLKGLFVIAKDKIIITKEGMKKTAEAEGLIALDTIYYPESGDVSCLTKVSGEKTAYPDDAEVFTGDQKLESIIAGNRTGKKHYWISGRLTALDKKSLESAKTRGLKFDCARFFSYEGLNEEFGDLINTPDRILVPDGYEITGKISAAELPLYGSKVYVNGNFTMEENDLRALEEIEAIIVKGKASLPSSAVKIFRAKGRADEYFVFEGRLVEVNGFGELSHSVLGASAKGSKITILVNGCLLFDKDVTAEDVECIASISYNGSILVSAEAKAALASKVKKGNGFMGDPDKLSELTGVAIRELIGKYTGENSGDSAYNMGTYILA